MKAAVQEENAFEGRFMPVYEIVNKDGSAVAYAGFSIFPGFYDTRDGALDQIDAIGMMPKDFLVREFRAAQITALRHLSE